MSLNEINSSFLFPTGLVQSSNGNLCSPNRNVIFLGWPGWDIFFKILFRSFEQDGISQKLNLAHKSWLKFCPFCLHESEQNEGKDFLCTKSHFFYQPSKLKKYLTKFWMLLHWGSNQNLEFSIFNKIDPS